MKRTMASDACRRVLLASLWIATPGLAWTFPQETRGVPNQRTLRLAAEGGDAIAQFNLGIMNYLGDGVPRDHAQALTWFRKSAEQGNVGAQYNLGHMYGFGQGVPANPTAAAVWLRKAAEQGHPMAQYRLGILYSKGSGVSKDFAQAEKWLRGAAAQGNAEAAFELAFLYFKIPDHAKDPVMAHAWVSVALSRGTAADHAQYATLREEIAAGMTPGQIADAAEKVREWEANGLVGSNAAPGEGASAASAPKPHETPVARRVGGAIKMPRKVKDVVPVYPEIAKQASVQGTVVLEIVVGPEGNVTDIKVLRNVPLLGDAAVAAVRQWTYAPTLIDGVPVPVILTVTVPFTLAGK